MHRTATAYAASALLHGLILGGLASWAWQDAAWEVSVQRGRPIMLVASLGPTAPEATHADAVIMKTPPMPREVEPTPVEIERQAAAREIEVSPDTPAPEQAPLQPAPQRPRASPSLSQPPESATAAQPVRRQTRTMEAPVAVRADHVSTDPPSVQVLSAGAEVDQPPQQLPNNPAPDYPLAARLAGWEGRVLLRVFVDHRGRVVRAAIHESSGHALLDDSALRTVRRWRFTAARRGPLAVESEVLVPVRFSLRNG